jgi:lysophospholipid acyltransferase (LPLAT)-like uncharacterized protein
VREVEKPRPLTLRTWWMARGIGILVKLICRSLRLTIEHEDRSEQTIRDCGGAILVSWHGRTMIPIHYFRNRGYSMLVSLSLDGDLISEVLRFFRLRVIRGSTGRRGVMATREVLTTLSEGNVVAFTPDGPRGPAGIAQSGVVYFAQRSGKPIIPLGTAAYPRILTKSWDRFLIPLPFAKAHWIYGEPIFVKEGDDLEEACRKVTQAIHDLEYAAERAVVPNPAEIVTCGSGDKAIVSTAPSEDSEE